ncbi:MAG: type I-B CRISPR-associated protein Cas5b [Hydrogenothermaceae bacterium]
MDRKKLIKIEIFQPKACYTTPLSFKGIETFPLPPYSTLRGMIYTAMGRKYREGDEIDFSIQGKYESIYRDYWTAIKFGDDGKDKKPIEVPTLHNLKLIIHIWTNIGDEIVEALNSPAEFLSLGRREDIIKIEKVKEIGFTEKDMDEAKKSLILRNNCYIPKDLELDIRGIYYRLPSFWEIKNGYRVFTQMKDVFYVEEPVIIEKGKIYIDDEGDPIWLKLT